GQGAVEQRVVHAPGGDVGGGGELVDHHALAGVGIGGAVPQRGEQRVQVGGAGVPQRGVEVPAELLLLLGEGQVGGRGHYVCGGQPLEPGDLPARALRQDGIAIVAGDGARSVGGAGGGDDGAGDATDQLAVHVLQGGRGAHRAGELAHPV